MERDKRTRLVAWAALLLILVLAAGLRGRLAAAPLERDEGEYAYAAQLILRGELPYERLYSMKPPGIYLAYTAILAVLGQTATAVHVGLLLVNAATTLLIFLLGRRLFDPAAGIAAALAFAVLSLGRTVHGLFANAEQFVIPFAVGGLLLLLPAVERESRRHLVLAGLLLGTAPLMKQAGAAFVVCGGLYLLYAELRRRPVALRRTAVRLLIFSAAAVFPAALILLALLLAGAFDGFWRWTVEMSLLYTSKIPLSLAPQSFLARAPEVVRPTWPLWLLAGVGLTAPAWYRPARRHAVFLLLAALLAFAAVCPGFYFRYHYFIYVLPFAALLAGLAARALFDLSPLRERSGLRAAGTVILIVTAAAWSLFAQRDYLFAQDPNQITRATFGRNPFVESIPLAEHIRQRTSSEDTIAVIGSEPQIYFYARRRAATGYIYAYPLMDPREFAVSLQREMIAEIERADPAALVFVNVPSSWLRKADSNPLLLEWFSRYSRARYELSALVEITREGSDFRWGAEAARAPRTQRWVAVLIRKDNPAGLN